MKALYTIAILSLVLAGCSADQIVGPGSGSIHGVVKDSRSQRPLANVQVYSLPGSGLALTDEQGVYRMGDVTPGDYILKAIYRDTSFTQYATMPVRVMANAVTSADIILKPGLPGLGVVRGLVVDESGRPVSSALVTTVPETGKHESNGDGSFLLTDIPYDSIKVFVTNGTLYGVAQLQPAPDVITNITITAFQQDPAKGSIAGKVTTRGEPVPGAIVHIEAAGLADTTDEQGMYVVRNVPAGQRQVSVTRQGFTPQVLTATFAAGIVTQKDIAIGVEPTIPLEQLELYVPFNGDIEDRSPQSHRMGLMSSRVTFVADRHGRANNAVQFTGANGVTTLDGMQMNFKPLTMAAWVKVPSFTNAVNLILGKTPHPTGDGYYIILENGRLVFMWVTGNWAQVSRTEIVGTFPRDEWMWVGFAMNGNGTGYVTVNGKDVRYIATSVSKTVNSEQFTIGNLPTTTGHPGFEGSLDQVVVYSRFLTAPELTTIMNMKE
jgi:hypothetical protein